MRMLFTSEPAGAAPGALLASKAWFRCAEGSRCSGEGWLAISKSAAAAFDLFGLTGSTLPPSGSSATDLTAVVGIAADPLLPAHHMLPIMLL